MATFHPTLTKEKWESLPRTKQILNIAAELSRARVSLERKEMQYLTPSLDRVFELLDLTIGQSAITRGMRKELLRFREMLGEWYIGIQTSVDDFKELTKTLLQCDPVASQVQL